MSFLEEIAAYVLEIVMEFLYTLARILLVLPMMFNFLDEGIMKMKKMIYVLPMILTSVLCAMQKLESNEISIPSNTEISYSISNASSEKINMNLFKITKSSQRMRIEALEDTLKKDSEERYSLQTINGKLYRVPRYVTMIMGFKFETSGISGESREIDLLTNANHNLMITFKENAYSIDVQREDGTEQLDSDTIANAKARFEEQNKKEKEEKL